MRPPQQIGLPTECGPAHAILYPAHATRRGVVLLGGTDGGLHGPAGIYDEMALYLQSDEIATLQFAYARPGDFLSCVRDMLSTVSALKAWEVCQIVLIACCEDESGAMFTAAARAAIAGIAGTVVGAANLIPARENDPPITRPSPAHHLRLLAPPSAAAPPLAPAPPPAQTPPLEISAPDATTLQIRLNSSIPGQQTLAIERLYQWVRDVLEGVEHQPAHEPRPLYSPLPPKYAVSAPNAHAEVAPREARHALQEIGQWLDTRWEAVLAALAVRDPARANAAYAAAELPHTGTPAGIYLKNWTAWRYLDADARIAWLASCATAWRLLAALPIGPSRTA